MSETSYEWNIPDSFHESLLAHEQQYRITSEIEARWDLADNTRKYLLDGLANAQQYFMLVSNTKFGNVAHRGALAAQQLRDTVEPACGDMVLTAETISSHKEFSYSIYPRCYTLSDNKLVGTLENLWCFPKALSWHKAMVRSTVTTQNDSLKAATLTGLQGLIEANVHGGIVTAELRRTSQLLSDPAFKVRTCAAHNDLWRGNMMKTKPLFGGIKVIDWPSMDLQGYPFFDLAKFLIAFRIPKFMARRIVLDYCAIFQCDPAHVVIYTYLSMAQLHTTLDRFPLHIFADLVERMRAYWVKVLPESTLS